MGLGLVDVDCLLFLLLVITDLLVLWCFCGLLGWVILIVNVVYLLCLVLGLSLFRVECLGWVFVSLFWVCDYLFGLLVLVWILLWGVIL